MDQSQRLRDLPAVHELLDRLAPELARFPRTVVVAGIRQVLEDMRAEIAAGRASGGGVEARVQQALAALETPSLRHVINATGVVLHTNLGRAPLGAMTVLPGYTNLEYDLAAGRRGQRDVHAGALLERLLGAPAIAVNNNAAAVFLALNELAAAGEVVVSRGELIEIGDGFRIPEIMARSGAVLREVGTTNRTRIADYRAAINQHTRLLMRVHPSNFRMTGFTARAGLEELVALGREHNIPVYEDLGSGCLVDLKPFGIDEPLVSESLKTGVDLVSFSGDKLMGGPQAGVLAGSPAMVTRLRRNPLFRALRLDKVMYQALENTLRNLLLERWECLPALAMLRQTADQIRARARALLARMPEVPAAIVPGESVIGGGATPEQAIPTWLIAVECPDVMAVERMLRAGDPPAVVPALVPALVPVVARIEDGKLILDLRTVFPAEEELLAGALLHALLHARS
ncbi:MAG TPA: L-seryl-tRNA(Sec) selenium transferase [Candidatus Acidoferrales bacterium]|nr:L-seryl-tRNA(Sec) selenium transferase [Candidatus Acidoferrales bacterium]